ncbi:DUF5691 domain-containing protein [Solitalea sp. MAHUQ-68]|uniref:DUF5691 domain-containing protein n=1 Tax=Solitalea agri TaxID=2953739 RepID=A0A9X2JGA0_9SPHI|nr:DUF5691 domain-containing protein [Solitalea agri]MCO4294221.1 DUF5691 domain-containing protein [Solitalea agri]
MQEDIIKTALLGTGKMPLKASSDLEDFASRIIARQEDKEDAFLKYAGLAFIYQESGLEPAEGTSSIEECAAETLKELNSNINQYLLDALQAKDEILFDYLIFRAVQARKVAPAAIVPKLLNKAIEQKGKADKILPVCGELGKWLCSMNPEWKKISEKESETANWETGNHEERQRFLKALRLQNPSEARELLIADFDQENAANRTDFIDLLETGLSLQDEEFLMKCLADKSKKVKESALQLLRILKDSLINKSFVNHLLKVILIKEERQLLILKKKVLHIDTSAVLPDEILQYGIEKVSSQKGVDDNFFQLAQLFAYVEPAVLVQALNTEKEEFFRLLTEHPQAVLLQPFLTEAALRFKDNLLAEKILSMDNSFNSKLLELISEEQKNAFLDNYIEQHLIAVLDILLDNRYQLLQHNMAERIIKRLAINPYQVAQPVYQRLALALPASLIKLLEAHANDDANDYQKRYFSNQAATMLRYIELRDRLHI